MDGLLQRRQSLHRQLQEHEDRIRGLQDEIRNAQKLATLGTMSCLVAHEFNNILTPIINYAELALKHPNDAQLIQKALEKAVKQGQRASQIIQSILGYARSNQNTIENLSIRHLIEECFQCLARDFQKDNIQVILDVPEGLEAELSGGPMQQVLFNLLINARHAMLEHGGTLTIRAGKTEEILTLSISDTGCGIAPELLDRIFEPFFTTKTKADRSEMQGTGLGLSVCKDIIESYNGRIEVSSEVGQGTTFTLLLPCRQGVLE